MSPGAGHLYAGDLRAAIFFWLAACSTGVVVKVSYALAGYSPAAYLVLMIVFGGGWLSFAAWSAWRAARRCSPERPLRHYQRLWFVLVAGFVMAEIPTRVARSLAVQTIHVPTDAMAPALLKGDFLLVTKLGARSRPERGAIVAFRPPGHEDVEVVKRVVALEGDQVEVRDGAVWVDGERASGSPVPGMAPTLIVPLGYIYVLGDNAAESGLDSRSLGPIPLDHYIGRAQGICMSASIRRIGKRL